MKKIYLKPDMTVHAIKLRFICDSPNRVIKGKPSTNLGEQDTFDYGGGGYGESR